MIAIEIIGAATLLVGSGCDRILSIRAIASTDAPAPSPDARSLADAGGPCTDPAQRCVFVTSQQYTPATVLTSETVADMLCGNAALNNGALVGLHFTAYLSDSSHNAIDRIEKFTGTYVLVDGTPVAHGYTTFGAGNGVMLVHAIDADERGAAAPTFSSVCGANMTPVWTGTAPNGMTSGPTETCQNWAIDLSASYGAAGLAQAISESWVAGCNLPCNNEAALYCIQQP